MKIPECISDYGNLERPVVSGLYTTLIVGKITGIVTLILLGDNPENNFPELKEQILATNGSIFLTGLATGTCAWIYHRMPKRLDNFIINKVEPPLNKIIDKLSK